MEDYVYHLDPAGQRILGAHMLEVCETIAKDKPVLDVQPLSIGGKENPARLIFTAPAGPAICASLIDLGNRFRMVVNEVEVVDPPADLPKLPVARVLWDPKPNLKVAAEAWILAGGAHHSVFTQALTSKYCGGLLRDRWYRVRLNQRRDRDQEVQTGPAPWRDLLPSGQGNLNGQPPRILRGGLKTRR